MNKVKDYNDVTIYVNRDGKFYCDVNENSNDWAKKTFESDKLPSIEKAINTYQGTKIKGKIYYDIMPWKWTIERLQVVRKTGKRLFFSDKTDTSSWSRKELYPSSIADRPEFKTLEELLIKGKNLQAQINMLYKEKDVIENQAKAIVRGFRKVKVQE